MLWVAPSEKDTATDALEKRLWDAADQLRANSGLNAAQYSTPVLGLIFLRFADVRFARIRAGLEKMASSSRRGSRVDEPAAYHAEGVLYLTPNARFEKLLHLPEGSNAGKAINKAMRDIEKHNPQLAGVLPKTYEIFNSTLLKELLKRVSEIPATIDYDAFGRIYEYFLGGFARTEGQKGGEFYTPSSIVRLLVEVLEPYHGRILDPSCGSGGMFVQSARFVAEHKKNPSSELAIHGQEKVAATVALCRMNLAMHGLEGDIKEARFGDVLINSTGVGTLGRVAQVYEDMERCTVDSHVSIIRPNADTDVDFFGCMLLLKQETFERLGVGATGQTELGRTAIGEVEIPVPPASLLKRFGALIRPTRTAVITLTKQCENLRRTRDLLLPRLLSGMIAA